MNDFFTDLEIASERTRPCRRAWGRGLYRVFFLVLLLVLLVPMQVLCWLEDKSGGGE